MSQFDHRPLADELEPKVEKPHMLDFEHLADDLKGAIETEGPEEVAGALKQVDAGTSGTPELLAWIDEMRNPETSEEVSKDPLGFLHDFEADTEKAADEQEEAPEADDGMPVGIKPVGDAPPDDEDDYVFSATRRRKLEEGEDDEGTPPGTEEAAKPKAAVKAPSKKS